MRLTVLSVAFPFAPVSPETVGGAEQILGDLDRALVLSGESSLVVACEGSRTSGKLFSFPLPACELLDEANKAWSRRQVQTAIDHSLASQRVDLIHMHGLDFFEYTVPATIPLVVTLHLPISWYPPWIWRQYAGRAQFCCVSESQRRSCPPELRDRCVVIENGVELSPRLYERRSDFALVVGRICAEKNTHEALEAGTRASTRVLVAGQVYPYREHQRYFAQKIRPLLQERESEPKHEFLGPLPPGEKQCLLSEAKCLLHPTLAPETSSLVAMEALAAGAPVIAYPSGALAEIVEPGVTGFLVRNPDEMADAIGRAHTISSEACRRSAERRFSKHRMIEHYLDLYQSMAQRKTRERHYA